MNFNRTLAIDLAEKIRALYAGRLAPAISIARTDTQIGLVKIWSPDFGDKLAILFPGTVGARDVATNLRAAKTKWGEGRAHEGFVGAFQSAAPTLLDAIDGQRAIIAGHSLGGALALLAADWVAARVEAVYTFGQPRVFNGPAARGYDRALADKTFRIVNHGDPVPKIPWLLGTYRHAGTEVYLPKEGPLEIAPSLWSKAAARVSELANAAPLESKWLALFNRHNLEAYLARLKRP